MKRRIFPLAVCAAGMLLLILDSRQACDSAREALDLCFRTIIPSLFPFFLLSAFMTGLGGGNLYFSGFLGGYPVGAQTLALWVKSGKLDQSAANRYLSWCSQAGPSFIFGIAASQFPHMVYGWALWGIQILSALTVKYFLCPSIRSMPEKDRSGSPNLSSSMNTALQAMASVCGWVILFRVILGFLDRWFFFLLPDTEKILISGLLELTNGCLMLQRIDDLRLRFLLCLLFLNFGGFCVVLQTLSVAENLDIRYYLAGKGLQCLFALCYGCLLFDIWAGILPISLIWLGRILRKVRKNSSNPAPVGV